MNELFDIDDVLLELSSRIPSGIPDLKRPEDAAVLFEILSGRIGADQAGILIAELSKAEKANVANIVSSFLKKMTVSKLMTSVDMQYPPRQTVISKQGTKYIVKAVIEFNGISNQERDPAFESIVEFCNTKGIKSHHKMSREMSSSAGYVAIALAPTIELWISCKGMKKIINNEVSDTDIKEGLVSMLYQIQHSTPVTLDSCTDLIEKLINHKRYMGETDSIIEKCKGFLVANKDSKMIIKLLNQYISQAAPMIKNYPKWIVDRNKIFSKIRTIAGQKSKMPADKWCPGDLYLINPKMADKIKEALAFALQTEDPAEAIQYINSLFVENWGDKDNAIVAISLKQAQAQGGKAKDFLKRFDSSKTIYNLSPEELSSDTKTLQHLIQTARDQMISIIEKSETTIHYDPPTIIHNTNVEKLKLKLGALKVFNFLMNQPNEGTPDQLIVSAIGFGLSLSGINPTFFKCVANKDGSESVPHKFPAGGIVTIYPSGPDKRSADITILDNDTSTSVSADLTIEKGSQICDVRLTSRSNGLKQVTLEIEKIKCRNQD